MLHWFAKRMTEARKDQRGFTLIELLVVVIIIGILAAIAIPTFLSQRDSAEEAAAETSLRNAATAQQAYFVDAGVYTSVEDDLTDFGFPQDGSVAINTPATGTADSYCMSTNDPDFSIRDTDGSPVSGGCP